MTSTIFWKQLPKVWPGVILGYIIATVLGFVPLLPENRRKNKLILSAIWLVSYVLFFAFLLYGPKLW